jgi:hypothetical protein
MGYDIFIYENDSLDLISLPSLCNLQDLIILNNNSLTTIDGFSKLNTAHEIKIKGNSSLLNINGLNSVDSVDRIIIKNNKSLTNINGIANIKNTKWLSIINNFSLNEILGFDNLSQVSSIEISENRAVTKIDAFNNLDTITGDLSIKWGLGLLHFTSFEKLKYIGGNMDISYCDQITTCPSFPLFKLYRRQFYSFTY